LSVAGRRIEVQGSVQGVGFRPWVWRLAHDLGVTGRIWNDAAGVTIEVFAEEPVLERLLDRLEAEPPRAAVIARLAWSAIPAERVDGFTIVKSAGEGQRRASIPADLATCSACLAEIFDPSDRRYRYPFTNCTDCGPRFTIAWDVPYDRPATTMAPFPMCAHCQREYDDPRDRRFHAQPNACPVCGPRLRMLDEAGAPLECDDPLGAAADALTRGEIVAIKGLGGYHLACDATSEEVVRTLRERKRREEKPFAVMVRDLDTARRFARVGPVEADLLTGVERPIVLLARAGGGGLATAAAPDAPRIGLMLPYTPLHHLLLEAVDRPLVMTSGNLSGEPIAHTEALAVSLLGGIADRFLVHDRAITTRTDDSVAMVLDGAPMLLRRSRGYVPRPVPVPHRFEQPVLAVGAHLKNTFCIGIEDVAWMGPHVGDLESPTTYDALAEAIERLERFLDVRPEVVAHDLHPGMLSTRYARERAAEQRVAVQHHHAHVAAAAAEHGLTGPVLGVAYDGTGLGPDGAAWGAEVMVVQDGRYERVATWRPIPLAGGDLAIEQPWRVALAWLLDAFDGEPPLEDLPLFDQVSARALDVARQQVEKGVNAPLAHGMGRRFDALAALALRRPVVTYEGQLAMAWEQAAEEVAAPPYPVDLDRSDPTWQVDDRPLLRAAVADLCAGHAVAEVSARFHAAVVATTAEIVRETLAKRGPLPVVATGGCFVNTRLVGGLSRTLGDSVDLRLHRKVPPGDGGIALGQAVVANALRAGSGA
jgi:hydrogenase maturation protein HypF